MPNHEEQTFESSQDVSQMYTGDYLTRRSSGDRPKADEIEIVDNDVTPKPDEVNPDLPETVTENQPAAGTTETRSRIKELGTSIGGKIGGGFDKSKEIAGRLKTEIGPRIDDLQTSIREKTDSALESGKEKFDQLKTEIGPRIRELQAYIGEKTDLALQSGKAKLGHFKEFVRLCEKSKSARSSVRVALILGIGLLSGVAGDRAHNDMSWQQKPTVHHLVMGDTEDKGADKESAEAQTEQEAETLHLGGGERKEDYTNFLKESGDKAATHLAMDMLENRAAKEHFDKAVEHLSQRLVDEYPQVFDKQGKLIADSDELVRSIDGPKMVAETLKGLSGSDTEVASTTPHADQPAAISHEKDHRAYHHADQPKSHSQIEHQSSHESGGQLIAEIRRDIEDDIASFTADENKPNIYGLRCVHDSLQSDLTSKYLSEANPMHKMLEAEVSKLDGLISDLSAKHPELTEQMTMSTAEYVKWDNVGGTLEHRFLDCMTDALIAKAKGDVRLLEAIDADAERRFNSDYATEPMRELNQSIHRSIGLMIGELKHPIADSRDIVSPVATEATAPAPAILPDSAHDVPVAEKPEEPLRDLTATYSVADSARDDRVIPDDQPDISRETQALPKESAPRDWTTNITAPPAAVETAAPAPAILPDSEIPVASAAEQKIDRDVTLPDYDPLDDGGDDDLHQPTIAHTTPDLHSLPSHGWTTKTEDAKHLAQTAHLTNADHGSLGRPATPPATEQHMRDDLSVPAQNIAPREIVTDQPEITNHEELNDKATPVHGDQLSPKIEQIADAQNLIESKRLNGLTDDDVAVIDRAFKTPANNSSLDLLGLGNSTKVPVELSNAMLDRIGADRSLAGVTELANDLRVGEMPRIEEWNSIQPWWTKIQTDQNLKDAIVNQIDNATRALADSIRQEK